MNSPPRAGRWKGVKTPRKRQEFSEGLIKIYGQVRGKRRKHLILRRSESIFLERVESAARTGVKKDR